jgi:L-alanine-DL-glutamate epimerase-like enolase superfamily enzyme
MRITGLKATLVRIPLRKPYVFARGTMSSFESVIVEVATDNGLLGYGESTPLPLAGRTAQALAHVIMQRIRPVVVGAHPMDIEALVNKAMQASSRDVDAVAGIDLALWDIMGKQLALPVYRLIGGLCQELIPVDYTMSADSADAMAQKALDVHAEGFNGVVVKVLGHDVGEDIARVKSVRRALPDSCTVRVDCNCCFSRDRALEFLKGIDGIGIELVEQPVAARDLEGMRKCREIGIPIAADESLETEQDAVDLIREKACDLMNIKVPKVGGLLLSKRLAGMAAAAGLPVIVGGRTTLELSRCASRHFAASTWETGGRPHEGPGPASQDLVDDVTTVRTTKATVRQGKGNVPVECGPGLGLEISREKLSQYAVPS